MPDLINLSALTLHPVAMDFRLTLETGVAVSTTDQTAKTTVYLTPYRGNRLALYDGTTWKMYAPTADVSLALGTLTSGKNYDVFAFDSSSNVTLEFSAAWTTDTARADALAFQDGILCKSGALTRRYLGTLRTTSTTTTEDSATKRFLYNQDNQRPRSMTSGFVSDSHAYTTSAWQEWHAGTASTRLQFVLGAAGPVAYAISAQCTAGAVAAGIGQSIDVTNNPAGLALSYPLSSSMRGGPPTSYTDLAAGFHYIATVEYGGAGDTFVDYNHVGQLLI
jgi:hypothetical protein